MTNLDSILKSRHYFADKGPSSQSYNFSSSHVWMWGLDHREGWMPKNWCFWTVVFENTLESPLDNTEIKSVNPKGKSIQIFIGRTDAEAEAPILWPPDAKSLLLLLLSHFSHVRLCVTAQTAAHQAPPSLGFSRQEHWSGLPFPSPMHVSEKWKWSYSVESDS